MKFPYGISDFEKIIANGYFYVDRTDRIPLIEETGDHLLFLRPRRFGKTLLLSMLKNYYDIAKADQFERLFGKLAVGKNPTGRHNQYFVLEWDFSSVEPVGETHDIRSTLHRYVNSTIKHFYRYYSQLLPVEIEIYPEDALASFQSLLSAISETSYKLYLLIDEYDNFANELMMNREVSKERYQALVYGEGCLKALFKVVKVATKGLGLDRAFITGVSPVVMSDMSSGHNISKNIYLKPYFNDLCGFRESEINDALTRIAAACDLPDGKADEALGMMRTFYNGYVFAQKKGSPVYNPTLAIYFLESFQEDCEYPEEMLDENLAMDRNKLNYIAGLPNGGQVIMDALNEEKPPSITRLARRFGVEDMMTGVKDNTFMASLLYYFGILTFGKRTSIGKHILRVPNLVVRGLFLEQLQKLLLPDTVRDELQQVAETFYRTGDMELLCDFVEHHFFKAFDNRDYRWANELTVKTAFLSLLFNDTFYITDSETALEREYADLTLMVRPDMRQYQLLDFLFEFKYIGLKENNLTGAKVKAMSAAELRKIAPIKRKLADSEAKLKGYRQTLETAYNGTLRLHCYSVVSIGFERLVWADI